MAGEALMGRFAKLYYNTGIYETPVWEEVGNATGVNLDFSVGEADATTRGNNGWKATEPTLKDGSIEFSMIKDTEDEHFLYFQNKWLDGEAVEIAAADRPIATVGCQYFRATVKVFNFTESQDLEDVIKNDVTLKPCYSAHAPEIVTVEA